MVSEGTSTTPKESSNAEETALAVTAGLLLGMKAQAQAMLDAANAGLAVIGFPQHHSPAVEMPQRRPPPVFGKKA